MIAYDKMRAVKWIVCLPSQLERLQEDFVPATPLEEPHGRLHVTLTRLESYDYPAVRYRISNHQFELSQKHNNSASSCIRSY